MYVDWYVLSSFADLGPIREVAYRSPWVDAHRAAARLWGSGGAALYSTPHRTGPPAPTGRVAWFSAPSGRGRALLDRWRRDGPPRGTLWRRQLSLGPSPEYCYLGNAVPPPTLVSPADLLVPEFLPVPTPARFRAR
jgi:hypothetical protein